MLIKHRTAAIILGTVLAVPALAHDITLEGALLSNNLSSNFEEKIDVGGLNPTYATASDTAIGGELALGYLWRINSGFGLEFDLYYDFLGLETKEGTTTVGFVSHKVDNMVGLRVLPMLNITQNTRIYLDLGFGYFEQTIDASKANDGSSTGSASSKTAGFRYGGGISTMIYDNISIALGYAVIDGGSSVSITSDDELFTYSATPTIQMFGTFVTWHFGF